jgi:ATP adenylyltransferase
MDQLWAPWRMTYIADIDKTGTGCVFCGKATREDDRRDLILHRGATCFVIMNLYPYNNGHLLVIPYAHVAEIGELDGATSGELWELLCRCQKALRTAIHPDGFNIGMNLGRVAGAGIDTHLHAHIVPRWNGDTNFMPVVGETKVISQALEATYDALLPVFRSMAGISSGPSCR